MRLAPAGTVRPRPRTISLVDEATSADFAAAYHARPTERVEGARRLDQGVWRGRHLPMCVSSSPWLRTRNKFETDGLVVLFADHSISTPATIPFLRPDPKRPPPKMGVCQLEFNFDGTLLMCRQGPSRPHPLFFAFPPLLPLSSDFSSPLQPFATRRKLPLVPVSASVPSPSVHSAHGPHPGLTHSQRVLPPHKPQEARAIDSVERRVLLERRLGRRGREGGGGGVRRSAKQCVLYLYLLPIEHVSFDRRICVCLCGSPLLVLL